MMSESAEEVTLKVLRKSVCNAVEALLSYSGEETAKIYGDNAFIINVTKTLHGYSGNDPFIRKLEDIGYDTDYMTRDEAHRIMSKEFGVPSSEALWMSDEGVKSNV